MRHVYDVGVVCVQLEFQRSMSCVVNADQSSWRRSKAEAGDGGATAINDVGYVDHIAKVGCQHQEQNTKTRIYCHRSVRGCHIHANGLFVVVSCHESLRLPQNATPRARMTLNRDRVFLCGSLHSPSPCIDPVS
jgi:hypothetical protein